MNRPSLPAKVETHHVADSAIGTCANSEVTLTPHQDNRHADES
ncbi:MAG: hypothetical protein ACKVJU_06870 [Verrucomicrobiales bacterium]